MVKDWMAKQQRSWKMIFRSKTSRKLVSRVMYTFGVKPIKIAKVIGVSRATVYRYVK